MTDEIVAWAFVVKKKGADDIVWCSYFSDEAVAIAEFKKAADLTSDEVATDGEGLTAVKIKSAQIKPGETKIVFDGK